MADYKATAAQLASIANAIRLKGGTSAALEYPSEWITAIQNLVPASGGSEITPADPTLEYKVTDTELISIANAIRTKGGTSLQLEFPSEFVTAIQNIPAPTPPIEIVSWSAGTDAQIVALLQAAHNGDIDLQQDVGWAIGDVRSISISAFSAGGGVSVPAQNVDIVISSFDDYNLCGCVMQFDFKDCLSQSIRMDSQNTNINGWANSEMKNITLPALVNALPTWLKNMLIEFSCLTSAGNKSSAIVSSSGKLALRSEIEIFGSTTQSASGEGVLIPYYNSTARRQKKLGHSGSDNAWYERSPCIARTSACYVNANGEADYGNTSGARGVAPFGCI